MNFNRHYDKEGLHAPFGASQSAWIRYDEAKLAQVYKNLRAKEIGTRIHAWAAETIKLGIKLPKTKKTINQYVNDGIGFRMTPEVVLVYSDHFFGTADTIAFRNKTLRIHDLKTGASGHMEQLRIYAALFCLEYHIKPYEIDIILRLYKEDEVEEEMPRPEKIVEIMDKIVAYDKILDKIDEE